MEKKYIQPHRIIRSEVTVLTHIFQPVLSCVFASLFYYHRTQTSGGSVVKNLLESRVQSLGREDPREKKMAAHSSILAQKTPWTEEPDGLQSMGLQKSWTQLSNTTTTTYRYHPHTHNSKENHDPYCLMGFFIPV